MNLGSFMLPKYRLYFSNFMYQIKTLYSLFFEDNCEWYLLKSPAVLLCFFQIMHNSLIIILIVIFMIMMIANDTEVNCVCYIMIFCLKNELICQVQVVKKKFASFLTVSITIFSRFCLLILLLSVQCRRKVLRTFFN